MHYSVTPHMPLGRFRKESAQTLALGLGERLCAQIERSGALRNEKQGRTRIQKGFCRRILAQLSNRPAAILDNGNRPPLRVDPVGIERNA